MSHSRGGSGANIQGAEVLGGLLGVALSVVLVDRGADGVGRVDLVSVNVTGVVLSRR